MNRKILAVDFDNTLFITDYPTILEPIWEVINYVKKRQTEGYILILWTCRHNDEDIKQAITACKNVSIEFDYINENVPELIEKYGDCRKIACDELIDDTCVKTVNNIIMSNRSMSMVCKADEYEDALK